MSTASTLTARLNLNPKARTCIRDGQEYVLLIDTGERSYGRDGGHCAFAYDAGVVDAWLDAAYADERLDCGALCEAVSPIEDRALAIYIAARDGLRLTRAGSCSPVLTDDEYTLVRTAGEAVGA